MPSRLRQDVALAVLVVALLYLLESGESLGAAL